jgi:DNA helicase HerA-like ATPase
VLLPPVLSVGTEATSGAKYFFLSWDAAPLKTRGFTVLGMDASRPGGEAVRVETDRRREHLFVLGATGAGKSNLLQHLSLQSIRRGAATVVIDFHGDLCEAILARLGPEDSRRLVYNTADVEYPIGLNLLAANGDPAHRWLVQDRAIQSFLALFD